MKKFIFAPLFALFASCGANDDKNEVENYPTYDTSQATQHINDSTSGRTMQSEGDLRHNIDSDGDEDRR